MATTPSPSPSERAERVLNNSINTTHPTHGIDWALAIKDITSEITAAELQVQKRCSELALQYAEIQRDAANSSLIGTYANERVPLLHKAQAAYEIATALAALPLEEGKG